MAKNKNNLNAVSPEEYSRHYYFSEIDNKKFDRFLLTGEPNKIFCQAKAYLSGKKHGPYLDIGCGRGEMAIYLGRQNDKVVGIDYSKDAITLCKELLKGEDKRTQTLVSFQLGTSSRLSFQNSSFQGVFLLDVVEHLTSGQLELTLKEIKRVLVNSGSLVIHTNNKYFEKFTKIIIAMTYLRFKIMTNPLRIIFQTFDSPYEYMHINYQRASGLKKILKDLGFEVKVNYVKPENKKEILKYFVYPRQWQNSLLIHLGWVLIHTPLERFLLPTFWIIAIKRKGQH